MMEVFKTHKTQAIWILVVILGCLSAATLAALFKDEAEKTDVVDAAKLVQTIMAEKVDKKVMITAYGIVQADREVDLRSEVSGRVVERAANMVEGGLVEKGEVLVRVDPRDYENALEQEKAALEKARFDLEIEQGRQLIAKREWEELSSTIKTSKLSEQLALRKPHLREKQAQVEAAKSRLKKAEIDLSRTYIHSPLDAIVISTNIQVGDYLSPQSEFAKLAGTDLFRVQTSIPVEKLRWLDKEAKVTVIQDLGGILMEREGYVLRLLGDLDPNGLMARVLVGVKDPLGMSGEENFPVPLLIGSYVKLKFEGRFLEDIFLLPRKVLREEDKVWVKNGQGKLEVRPVKVIQKDEEFVYIGEGLNQNDEIVASPLATPIPGMLLKTEEGASQGDG